MRRNIFETIYNTKGMLGIQSKACQTGLMDGDKESHQVVLLAWRSPHATAERNAWLERKLRKIYSKYYLMVMLDSFGLFW